MTFTVHLKHVDDGQYYVLPNYTCRENAINYITWYEKHYGQTDYFVEAKVK